MIRWILAHGISSLTSVVVAIVLIRTRWSFDFTLEQTLFFTGSAAAVMWAALVLAEIWTSRRPDIRPFSYLVSFVCAVIMGSSVYLAVTTDLVLSYVSPIKFLPLVWLTSFAWIGIRTVVKFKIVNPLFYIRGTSFTALATTAVVIAACIMAFAWRSMPGYSEYRDWRTAYFAEHDGGWRAKQFIDHKFDKPIQFVPHPADADTGFVVERNGRIFAINAVDNSKTLVLDIRHRVSVQLGGENGFWSAAFDPLAWEQLGKLKLYYTYSSLLGSGEVFRLARIDLTDSTGMRNGESEEVVFEQLKSRSKHHYGGGITFGGDDLLYVAIGDGYRNGIFGGIMRINPRVTGDRKTDKWVRVANYTIPKDNPFIDDPNVSDELWSIGFRNPFRISFDDQTGNMWVGDVGGSQFEEVNIASKGTNHQWPFYEGFEKKEGIKKRERLQFGSRRNAGSLAPPVHAYPHDGMRVCVIGGFVYRGDKFAELSGKYLFADNYSGEVFLLDSDKQRKTLIEPVQGAGTKVVHMVQWNDKIVLTDMGSMAMATGRLLSLEPAQASDDEVPLAATPMSSEHLYATHCAGCHGLNGSPPPSSYTQTRPRDLTDAAWHEKTTDNEIAKVIREGGEAAGMSSEMPGWQGVISPDDTDRLVKYIRNMKNDRRTF